MKVTRRSIIIVEKKQCDLAVENLETKEAIKINTKFGMSKAKHFVGRMLLIT